MRPLEISIPALLAVYLVCRHPRPLWIRLLPAAALILTLFHFSQEGYRWQMIPLYTITPMLAMTSLAKFTTPTDWPATAPYPTLFLTALCTALPILLPVPKIPAPNGEYPAGTRIFELTDPSRRELYSGFDEPRRFMVQAWYPGDISSANDLAPWMANAETYAPAIAAYIDLPPFFLDHLSLVRVPAYQDAEPDRSKGSHPLILFSHGWNGFNSQNTSQALELASHGFVVIAIQHTYGAVTSVFPDGTVAPNNPQALPEDENDPDYEIVARKLAGQWAGDLAFTLDFFTRLNREGENSFAANLQLDHVGVYGHSTGGGAAIQFCATDRRCKSVLGMDPFMRPVTSEVIEGGLTQPSLFMFSQGWADEAGSRNNELFDQFRPHLTNNMGVIAIAGTKHFDFSDLPLLSPIAPQLGLKGPLNGQRVIEIVNSLLLDFFQMTLYGKPSGLIEGSFDAYPEIIVLTQGKR